MTWRSLESSGVTWRYLVLSLSPAMATFFPLSSPNTDTYTLHTCRHKQEQRQGTQHPRLRHSRIVSREGPGVTWRSLESSTSAMVVGEER